MNSHLALIFFKAWLHASQSSLLLKLKNSAPTYPCRCRRHRRRRPPPPGTGGKGKIMVESQKPICSLTLPCPCVQGECDFELSNDIWIVATVALAALFMVRGKEIMLFKYNLPLHWYVHYINRGFQCNDWAFQNAAKSILWFNYREFDTLKHSFTFFQVVAFRIQDIKNHKNINFNSNSSLFYVLEYNVMLFYLSTTS